MTEPLKAVEAEADVSPDGAKVPLTSNTAETVITVPPPGRWKTRANTALRQGDFDGWAALVLSDEDYDAWIDADPTNDNVEEFFKAWREITGEDQGKSRASRRSSRSTARR